MQQYYSQHPRFYHAVDCIIFGFSGGELNLLLLKRKFDPGKGEWSLMGGFVREGEHMNDAAKRVLAELTGLTNVFMEQVGSFGQVDRDPGERVISTAYYALININEYDRNLVEAYPLFDETILLGVPKHYNINTKFSKFSLNKENFDKIQWIE